MEIVKIPKSGKNKGVVAGIVKIDDEDASILEGHGFWIGVNGYAYIEKNKTKTLLHRAIMKAKNGDVVDHINRNRLDCRKENLRFVTISQNSTNGGGRVNQCGYRGVKRNRLNVARKKLFSARIFLNKKETHLGSFFTAFGAAFARDLAARELHGEFASFNFPEFKK